MLLDNYRCFIVVVSSCTNKFKNFRRRDLSEESRAATDHFSDYLKKNLPPAAATEIWRQTRHAITKITEVCYVVFIQHFQLRDE